ncbi:MAG: Spx/MgsR family RNA polymerase-binding regulatory protein [Bacilli bacterium]|nr:Spx/MgsR family RNA polymerase-binding regulatory protein [Bacilli bacterium]
MIRVYTSPSCSSCRKVKEFLKKENIEFVEKNIFASVLNEDDLKDILAKSENGVDDIISKRSKIIKESNVNIDDMKLPELIDFIRHNPTVLKRPIIVNDRLIQVGYNNEEIRVFLPKELKCLINDNCSPNCPGYAKCSQEKDWPK